MTEAAPVVRNCREIGVNLQKIMNRLLANDALVKLLYYTGKDPLSEPNLTKEQKDKLIFNKLIRIIPRAGAEETEDAKSFISLRVVSGHKLGDNKEFRRVNLAIEVFVPLTQWFIKGTNLRVFSILGEIQDSLEGKTVDGLGRMTGGDFSINYITDEICCYEQTFSLVTYD